MVIYFSCYPCFPGERGCRLAGRGVVTALRIPAQDGVAPGRVAGDRAEACLVRQAAQHRGEPDTQLQQHLHRPRAAVFPP